MKGIVMETTDSSAVILSEDGTFLQINNQNYTVGQTVVIKETKTKKKLIWSLAVAAVFMIITMSGFAYFTPTSYVSLDVNPSIEYKLNVFERVLDVNPVNEDAKPILVDLKLKNKSIENAVNQTISQLIEKGYILSDENGGVIIAASNERKNLAESLSNRLKISAQNYIKNKGKVSAVESTATNSDKLKQAKAKGVTPGKLILVEKLKQNAVNPDEIHIDEWLHKSVRDIKKAIRENKKANIDKQTKSNDTQAHKKQNSKTNTNISNETKKDTLTPTKQQNTQPSKPQSAKQNGNINASNNQGNTNATGSNSNSPAQNHNENNNAAEQAKNSGDNTGFTKRQIQENENKDIPSQSHETQYANNINNNGNCGNIDNNDNNKGNGKSNKLKSP